ncbi:MAG: FG-GAP-like repeat-containing protein [Acidobacteriaceae bacterium]
MFFSPGLVPRRLQRRLPAFIIFVFSSISVAQAQADGKGFTSVQVSYSGSTPQTVGVADAGSLWPGGVVYYDDGGCITNSTCPNLAQAISTFNKDFSGAVQWAERTTQTTYVVITLSGTGGRGDVNTIGYPATPGPVNMNCNTDCNIATLLHEMGHIIGLYHEQTRTDRNSYVTMYYGNVVKSTWPGNFAVNMQNQQLLTAYDYASVMQYPAFVDSSNGGPVIETIPPGIPLAGAEGVPGNGNQDYSAGDKEAILRLYGHAPTAVTITSNPIGLQVIVDGTTYTTPQSFSWTTNSSHTLSVASGVQTLTGDIENSAQPATFYYTYGTWSDSSQQSHSITVTPGNGSPAFPTTAPAVATYTANFIELVPYTETVSPSGSGAVGVSPQPQTYSGATGTFFVARQQAMLTATPNSGSNFYEFNEQAPYFWLPGGLSANPKTFYVPDTGNPVAVNGEFTTSPVYTVSVAPSASIVNPFSSNLWAYVDGNFWYTPKNFSPDTSYDGTSWNAGSTHTLSLSYNGDMTNPPEYPYSANSRYEFSSWSDGGAYSHTTGPLISANTTFTAAVNPVYAPSTNFGFPPCGGTAGIAPTSTDDGFYPSGTQLTYTATPASEWTFAGWTFDLTGTASPTNLTADGETLVYANFNTTNTPLTITSLNPASVSAGSSSFTLTINGTGFTSGSKVSVNGTLLSPANVVSSTELQITVTSSLVASPATFDVFVENFPSGSTGCAVFGYDTFAVTASGVTPTVTVIPSSSSITTAQSDQVGVTVSGGNGNPTPTGSVKLSSGSYTSSSATLVSGSANITIPAGSLAVGSDTLTATYTPDSGSASTYNSAAGLATVTVAQAIGSCSTANPNPNPNPQSFAAVRDFNGDCKSDILWRNTSTQQVYEWFMNGTTYPSSGSPGSPTSDWVIQGSGDFNGDGKADLLWRNSTTGQVYIWLMNGSTLTSSGSLGYITSDWTIKGIGDFTGNGKSDILWWNSSTGQVYLWLINGTTMSGGGSISYVSGGWNIVGVGDFNGDGKADILWRNSSTGQIYIWLMSGATLTTSGSLGSVTSDWKIAGVGDFNNDGKSDILWQNSTTGQVYLWLINGVTMSGGGSISYVSSGWNIEGVGDYDGSGRAGILWRNTSTNQVYIWLMNGATLTSSGSPGAPDNTWQIAP